MSFCGEKSISVFLTGRVTPEETGSVDHPLILVFTAIIRWRIFFFFLRFQGFFNRRCHNLSGQVTPEELQALATTDARFYSYYTKTDFFGF